MKNFMQPTRAGILRENNPENLSSCSNPSSQKQRSSSRKQKFSKENAPPVDPNAMIDPSPSKPPLPTGKIRSPLPPRPPCSNPNPLKRKLSVETVPENCVSGSSDSGVQVIVRMRPLNKDEEEGEKIVQKLSSDSLSILGHTFTFDSVADTESSQQDIFELVGAPLVENCLAGFNSSIFAYGQTGSGKTYTMWGPANALSDENTSNDQQGLTPRVFEQLFARIDEEQVKHSDKQLKYQCRCSFLEIYNEQITDLLDPTQRNLQIREDVKSGVYVENLTEEYVSTIRDLKKLLIKGLSNRRIGATSINAESSRSHSVFTCVVESRCKSVADGLSNFRISRINLVDLAGSERQKLTGAAGDRLREAGNINRSLSQLGNLINILAEVSQTGKQRHIPYRDSRLTFLLQESLGGNAKLAMICAISPAQSCRSETFSTLRFAHRAKAVKNRAVVNEVTQDDVNFLREVIRQLRDELLRMKTNGPLADSNGVHSTSWNARRSLNLLKLSLSHPMTLPRIDDDSDEEMEIDEEAVEKLCVQVGLQSDSSQKGNDVHDGSKLNHIQSDAEIAASEHIERVNTAVSTSSDDMSIQKLYVNDPTETSPEDHQDSEEIDVQMEDCQLVVASNEVDLQESSSNENVLNNQNVENMVKDDLFPANADLQVASAAEPIDNSVIAQGELPNRESTNKSMVEKPAELELKFLGGGPEESVIEEPSKIVIGIPAAVSDAPLPNLSNSPTSFPNSALPSNIVSLEVSPVLHSPTLSISPRVNSSSRKSLRTLSMLSASQKDLSEDSLMQDASRISFAQSLNKDPSKVSISRKSRNSLVSTEHLAASLHRGLEIIDSHRQCTSIRSSFRFSFKQAELKSILPVNKVDVGVQTLPHDYEVYENPSSFLCCECKAIAHIEPKDANDPINMQLAPIDDPSYVDKAKKQVPKAVEKVLAGSFRREMALEEYCARQTAEIMQLNRLVQQYKHERECNAILEQSREDKIIRLESLMDGVLSNEDFLEEELLSLRNEHKLLKEKYENHPEVLRAKIELKRIQDELDGYRNFFDMGERDVLIEEIQHLRSQLQFYMDSSSSLSSRRQSSLLQLTYSCEPSSSPLCTIPETTEDSAEDKFEQERRLWTEAESRWISLADELRIELDASRSLAAKQKQELDSERKCSEELKEAMKMAMQGHARILEQYAELQEKHIALLARHRKMQEGVEDVKKAAAKAGVKGAESRFINSLASEISALKVEREKEKRYLMDENKGLRTQLRDTAEAVQAAGELLVRLKEAEEVSAIAQKQAFEAEKEAEKAYKEIDKLKKKHQEEIATLHQFLAESRLPKEALRPAYDNSDEVNYEGECRLSAGDDQKWREEFEPFYHGEDSGISKLVEPSSWFTGYDRCNI